MTILLAIAFAFTVPQVYALLVRLDSRAALRDGERRHHPIILATLAAGWPIVLAVCVPVLVLEWWAEGREA